MRKYKLLLIIQAILIFISMFAGCSTKDDKGNDSKVKENENTSVQSGTSTPQSTESAENNDSSEDSAPGTSLPQGTDSAEKNDEILKPLTATKLHTMKRSSISKYDGGLVYRDESGKYGILSLDGKNDTGAKYDNYKGVGKFFIVQSNPPAVYDDVADYNSCGLVDGNGTVLVPEKYATMRALNERFVWVCEVTAVTDDESNALTYITDRNLSISPDSDDVLLAGNWYVYDVVKGDIVKGVTGTKNYTVIAYGNFIEYTTDAKEKVVVDANGDKVPEDTEVLDNGMYTVESGDQGVLYDANGKVVYRYTANEHTIYPYDYGEYVCVSKYVSGEFKYFLINSSGKVVTAEFGAFIQLYGDLIHAGEELFYFDGKKVIDGKYSYVSYEKVYGNIWLLKKDNVYTFINRDGEVLYQGEDTDDIDISTYDFTITKTVDGEKYVYNFTDKDFSIKSRSSCTVRLVKVDSGDGLKKLVDVFSGETVIEGYGKAWYDYEYVKTENDGVYIYAYGVGFIDIYKVN